MSLKLSCVILTKNEEKNIERVIKSVAFCDEIIVVDDFSEDKTIEEVKKFKSLKSLKVYKRRLNGDFSTQRNFGLEKAMGEWVLFLDADEEVTAELKKEIISESAGKSRDPVMQKISAFHIKRRDWFWGREVKFGEIPRWIGLIRLVRKNSGRWEGRVHERFKVQSAGWRTRFKVKSLKNYINHYPHPTVKEFLSEVNFYSSLRAQELCEQGKKTNILKIILYPFGKFLLTYFLKLGFLDGASGFVYGFMMSFHSFLVRTKLYLLRRTDLK